MTKIAISSVRPLEVDTRLATELRYIGFRAWEDAYGNDIPDEYIKRRFDTTTIPDIEQAITDLQISSHIGRLVVASLVDDDGSPPFKVGYAAASNELARQPLRRLTERLKHPLHHAHIQLEEISVLPAFQGQGIGKHLLHQVFERFPGQQVPSVWVPEIGLAAKGLLTRMGFKKAPNSRQIAALTPSVTSGRFPSQTYYAAPSVSAVLEKTSQSI